MPMRSENEYTKDQLAAFGRRRRSTQRRFEELQEQVAEATRQMQGARYLPLTDQPKFPEWFPGYLKDQDPEPSS